MNQETVFSKVVPVIQAAMAEVESNAGREGYRKPYDRALHVYSALKSAGFKVVRAPKPKANSANKVEDVICKTCCVQPVDKYGWCAKCGNYTCLDCGVSMRRRDLQRRSAGFQCPECNNQKFD